MKRDAWTSNFNAMIYALDFPESEVDSPSQPDLLPGGVVHIPDPNLHVAIAEALGKTPNVPITAEEMGGLNELRTNGRGIEDLTGLQFATNVTFLQLEDNKISDLSPIAGLIKLRDLRLARNSISDISPLKDLKNLKVLGCSHNPIFDISPLAGLTELSNLHIDRTLHKGLSPLAGLINLAYLNIVGNDFTDLSPLAGLVNLKALWFSSKTASDLSPLSGLSNLNIVHAWGNPISDLSPLSGLKKLERIDFCGTDISDITPLVGLTDLKELVLIDSEISDISPIAGLTGLNRLNLSENDISDISPLASLINLTWLDLSHNEISNFSPLDGLRENIKLIWFDNPAFPKGGPKIEGPWLWVVLPDTRLDSSTDLLSEASGSTVTEVEIATHGAAAGKSVGDGVWTSHKLPPTGWNNIEDMLKRSIDGGVIYGSVSLYSPRDQDTTMYVGSENEVKIWLNGTLIYERLSHWWGNDYQDFFPVTLQQGRNVLLVAVATHSNGFFGFEPGTDYTVSMGVGYTFSKTPIHTGDPFTFNIRAENITDLAGWQFDITFDPAILEAINVTEGTFLKTDGVTTFFQGGTIDNAAGKITGLSAARLSASGVSGTGTLIQVRFKAKSGGETDLTLHKFQFGSVTGDSIPAGPHEIRITVEERLATGDVNRDGVVSILDLILVAQQLGKRMSAGSVVDVNGDGIVSILDLIRVAQGIAESPAAPPLIPPPRQIGMQAQAGGEGKVDPAMIEGWIAQARLEDDGSLAFKQGIETLENLLASLIPEETALLANYPNPFNPETWIPYQLAIPGEVTLTIYDINGQLIRRLAVGHQAAGMYQSRSRAVHWDGRNQLGESVASGLYFYTLTVDDFTATRRMLILK